ncbi:response regulator [Sulfitobacter sp. M57]|uniref:response regulator n=1 Tax=unclassified Sulfitobacter TaxID=196795 RepID=UPI0023E29B0F|nr:MULTISPECIES: response regulator [unclassified Sulfitobacter]MDF3415737.1 response regulator [Sulfitobacter sp. KE5]MDF3423217.1 response regulator [Sulfitobacter sp. KE43]MDF3434283.1 response regulator [Sulfitobacter sp. KE42]MDF3459684.1 response regulator [Sulfitobacter sp. S74]MDF3463821.1 response regulator [Sulfitobacter sp. Ks18]
MPAAQTARPSPFNPLPARAPLAVLILDDERFDRHRLARLCSGLDFPCTVSNATSLTEFQDQLERTVFGLVLLDYHLPDGTGIEALKMMQLSARNLNTPSLMVSGLAQNEVMNGAEAAGCSGFLEKDNLCAEAFTRAVTGALPLTAPLLPAEKSKFDAAVVEQLLARNAAICAQDIKPMVSRLMRQMRNLRSQQGPDGAAATSAAEQSCQSLWSFLIEMADQDGATLLANITDTAITPQATSNVAKGNKPPSPFRAPRH